MNDSDNKIIQNIKEYKSLMWFNENKKSFSEYEKNLKFTYDDIVDAEKRLIRFAPLIMRLFPETEDGIIESPFVEIASMKTRIEEIYGKIIPGRLFLKCDSHLKVAGSIKARGGIYEVLKHAETLASNEGLLTIDDDYSILAEDRFRKFFSNYKIGVGSTGNLGLSIGIISSALGFQVTVHMSRDAKEWKKQLLRARGAVVIEYEDDYSKAIEEGRKQCMGDSSSYFIDDENSRDLFLGYSVAALRLKRQLEEKNIKIDKAHKLYVYIPCGVGGAPGGITFGLKCIFKDNVHCFFAEPTHSPCMLLGLITQKFDEIHVSDYGIDNITEADGLAVGSPSGLVCRLADKMLDGIYTVPDNELFKLLALLKDTENIKIEPSAAAAITAPAHISADNNSVHIVWATGGLFLPDGVYELMYNRGKKA